MADDIRIGIAEGKLLEKGDKLAFLNRSFARAERALAVFRSKPIPELREFAVQELSSLSNDVELFGVELKALIQRILDELEE